MAHPNINDRQQHVANLLREGVEFTATLKRELAAKYKCSTSAIYADVVAFTRPKTKETPFQSAAMRKSVLERDGRECQYCNDRNAYEYIIEHIIPAALGGVAREYNLVVACQRCNIKKGRSVWEPRNLAVVTKGFPEWRSKIVAMAQKNET